MLEIYLLTSLAPIPVATLSNRELGGTGQNYIKSLFAVGFQGHADPCLCCNLRGAHSGHRNRRRSHWGDLGNCVGYTVLLCFMLMKTGTISKSIFSAH